MAELKSRVKTMLTVNHANRLMPVFNQKQKIAEQVQQNPPSLQKNSNIIIYQRPDISAQHSHIYQFKSQNCPSLPNLSNDSNYPQLFVEENLLPPLSSSNHKNACPQQYYDSVCQMNKNDKNGQSFQKRTQNCERIDNVHGRCSSTTSDKIVIQNQHRQARQTTAQINSKEKRSIRAITTLEPVNKEIPNKLYTQTEYKCLIKMLVEEQLRHNLTKERFQKSQVELEQIRKKNLELQQKNILFQTQLQQKCILIGQLNTKILKIQQTYKSLEVQNASLKTWKQSYEALLQLKTDQILKLNSKTKEAVDHLKQTTDLLSQKELQILVLKQSQFELNAKITQFQSKIQILSLKCEQKDGNHFGTQTDEYDLRSQIQAQLKKEHAIQLNSLAKKLVYFQKMLAQIEQQRKDEQKSVQSQKEVEEKKVPQTDEQQFNEQFSEHFEHFYHNPFQIYSKQLQEVLQQTTEEMMRLRMQRLNDRYNLGSACMDKKILDSTGDEIHSDSTENNENQEEGLSTKIIPQSA